MDSPVNYVYERLLHAYDHSIPYSLLLRVVVDSPILLLTANYDYHTICASEVCVYELSAFSIHQLIQTKTTLLSNIVDSFYETARTAFSDVTQSDGSSGYQYYKAITPAEIHIGNSSAPLKLEMGNSQLVEMCRNCAAISQSRKLIFIADADDKNTNKDLGASSGNFKSWGNNVYSFILPVPQHRQATPKFALSIITQMQN